MNSEDYDDIIDDENIWMQDEIPDSDTFSKENINLCIMDEVVVNKLNKEQEKRLNKLFTYVSSHKRCTVILCGHDYSQIPPPVRRSVDVFIVWKLHDYESQKQLCKKFGLKNSSLYTFFKNYAKSKYDFLMVDMLDNSPAKFRLNGYYPLNPEIFEGNDEIDDEIDKREYRKQKNLHN